MGAKNGLSRRGTLKGLIVFRSVVRTNLFCSFFDQKLLGAGRSCPDALQTDLVRPNHARIALSGTRHTRYTPQPAHIQLPPAGDNATGSQNQGTGVTVEGRPVEVVVDDIHEVVAIR